MTETWSDTGNTCHRVNVCLWVTEWHGYEITHIIPVTMSVPVPCPLAWHLIITFLLYHCRKVKRKKNSTNEMQNALATNWPALTLPQKLSYANHLLSPYMTSSKTPNWRHIRQNQRIAPNNKINTDTKVKQQQNLLSFQIIHFHGLGRTDTVSFIT